MLPNWLQFVDNDAFVDQALEFCNSTIIGVDTETTGLEPRIPSIKMRLIQIGHQSAVSVFDVWKLNQESKSKIAEFLISDKRKKVFHNAKFDLKFIYKEFGIWIDEKIFDTMIASQLIACGSQDYRHSLEHVLHRVLSVVIDKDERLSNWKAQNLREDQIIYGANDVRHLVPLREKQFKEIFELGLEKTAKLEFECISTVAEMEYEGILVDEKKWKKTADRQKIRMQRAQIKISRMLEPSSMLFDDIPAFNIRSYHELKLRLKKIGVQLPLVKDPKNPGCFKETMGVDELEKIKHTHPIIPWIIKHAHLKKSVDSYGHEWLNHINKYTGRVHSSYNQVKAETGRFSNSDPNLQQIPAVQIYRRCFVAKPGFSMITADYSQIELRILAQMSGDENMIRAFVEGKDLHAYTAALVFAIEYGFVTPAQRRIAKDLNFGIVYGIGPDAFAASAKLAFDQAVEYIRSYFRAYPRLQWWLESAARQAVVKKYSRTFSGRMLKYEFNERDSAARSLAERNGKNMPIQGGSADITKIALPRVRRIIHPFGKVIHCVHDEIVCEVQTDHAEEMKEKIREQMVIAGQACLTKVPCIVDVKIAQSWSK